MTAICVVVGEPEEAVAAIDDAKAQTLAELREIGQRKLVQNDEAHAREMIGEVWRAGHTHVDSHCTVLAEARAASGAPRGDGGIARQSWGGHGGVGTLALDHRARGPVARLRRSRCPLQP